MGHQLQAIITSLPVADKIAEEFDQAKVIFLPQGFAIIPATFSLDDQITEKFAVNHDEHQDLLISAAEQSYFRKLSNIGPIAYIETDYFGGVGEQSAILWEKGKAIFGPENQPIGEEKINPGPIAKALRKMGANAGEFFDEFNALGLENYSGMDELENLSIYPATYIGKEGTVRTQVLNIYDRELYMRIGNIVFKGWMFDDFEACVDGTTRHLSNFSLQCEIPIILGTDNDDVNCILKMNLVLNDQEEKLILGLKYNDTNIKSGGTIGCFEDEMLNLQHKLPPGHYFKNCFGCLYSDYHVAGQGLFGSMMCFRDNKENYLRAKTKDDLIEVFESMTEQVQETHLCPEFKKRIPGTGYRG